MSRKNPQDVIDEGLSGETITPQQVALYRIEVKTKTTGKNPLGQKLLTITRALSHEDAVQIGVMMLAESIAKKLIITEVS